MKHINIKGFLDIGEFIHKKKNAQTINEIIKNSDENWNGISIYTFEGYKIEFIIDDDKTEIKAEQIHVWNMPNNPVLNQIYLLKEAKENLEEILATYFDDTEETILFLKNGINIHYNSGKLSLITSKSEIARRLISETMTKKVSL